MKQPFRPSTPSSHNDDFSALFKQPFRPSEPGVHRDDLSGILRQPFRPSGPAGGRKPGSPMPGKGLWRLPAQEILDELENFLDDYLTSWEQVGATPAPQYSGFTLVRECTNGAPACGSNVTSRYVPNANAGGVGSCGVCSAAVTSKQATFALAEALTGNAPSTSQIQEVWKSNVSAGLPHYLWTRNMLRVPGVTGTLIRTKPVRYNPWHPPEGRPLPAAEARPDEDPRPGRPRPYLPPYAEPDSGAQPPVEITPNDPDDRPDSAGKPGVKTRTLPKPQGPRGEPPVHYRVPDKKKKIQMPPWLFTLLKVYHGGTEIIEAFDCLYDALPSGNTGKITGLGKISMVFERFEDIDWVKAMGCIAYNQLIEDKLVGKFNQILGKNFKGVGGPNTTQITEWGRQMKDLR